jgi:predicted solute-binding protein
MITIEFDEDETFINIMDDTGKYEDLGAILYDDICYLRQWNEKANKYEVIAITAEMYLKLMEAWKLPQGTYVMNK